MTQGVCLSILGWKVKQGNKFGDWLAPSLSELWWMNAKWYSPGSSPHTACCGYQLLLLHALFCIRPKDAESDFLWLDSFAKKLDLEHTILAECELGISYASTIQVASWHDTRMQYHTSDATWLIWHWCLPQSLRLEFGLGKLLSVKHAQNVVNFSDKLLHWQGQQAGTAVGHLDGFINGKGLNYRILGRLEDTNNGVCWPSSHAPPILV